jgi:hypothetical protein
LILRQKLYALKIRQGLIKVLCYISTQFTSGFNPENLGKTISLGMVTSVGIEPTDVDWMRYYRYLGSLNTPPCTERPSVVWSLLKSPLTASPEQLKKVSAALLVLLTQSILLLFTLSSPPI